MICHLKKKVEHSFTFQSETTTPVKASDLHKAKLLAKHVCFFAWLLHNFLEERLELRHTLGFSRLSRLRYFLYWILCNCRSHRITEKQKPMANTKIKLKTNSKANVSTACSHLWSAVHLLKEYSTESKSQTYKCPGTHLRLLLAKFNTSAYHLLNSERPSEIVNTW